ncbi:MAG: ROK family protein [Chloroflexi bacterium]|nr:ROK family protein [Chloroflexota bacterium]
MGQLLVLDFGGTKLTAAMADTAVFNTNRPIWQAQQRVLSPPGRDANYDIETMIRLGWELLAGKQPTAVGVSFGGPVDYAAGRVRLSHHVPGWENVPLQQILVDEFGTAVHVDNDANAAALGEYRFGAGQGVAHLLYVTVSTGVGGGWILDGRPFRGANSMAGEIGHMTVDPAGPLCLCGKRGCVERLASGPYMAQDWAALPENDGATVTGQDVAEMAAQGVETAVHILERGAWALGVGIGNAVNLINPQRVVLGGGVTKSGERWWQMVRQTAQQTALPEVQFTIVPTAFTDDAPLWGASALLEEEIG